MTQRKKLPIGIQTLEKIRLGNYYYVDKTQLALDLIDTGTHYFLSRPRRFGKSLFLDTLKEIFEGNEKLFKGLAIHKQWDWTVKYPVLRFSFGSSGYKQEEGLQAALHKQLSHLEQYYNITPQFDDADSRFADLIIQIHKREQRPVVILIDEYDKPILDAINTPEIAKENRDTLHDFYSTIKDYDAHIKFSFLTGVSKFSKVNIFSGLNNLEDITLSEHYATVCGYTDDDLDTVFAAELEGLDREEIRAWYNGYNWLGEGVYNPFGILQLFKKRKFSNYWFETGTPTFLVDWLIKHNIHTPELGKLLSNMQMLSSFDVEYIDKEALLFQTGYLTIKKEEQLAGQYFYTLGYPNREVEQSLNSHLLATLIQDRSKQVMNSNYLYQHLLSNNFAALEQLFHSFFASIPHHWYNSNTIQEYEGYYASVFYSYFAALGLDVTVEDCTNLGRIDMTLKFNHQVYIFEFKVVELTPKGKALQQIKDKGYADKYKDLKQPIHLIGVEFSKETRNIEGFERETIS